MFRIHFFNNYNRDSVTFFLIVRSDPCFKVIQENVLKQEFEPNKYTYSEKIVKISKRWALCPRPQFPPASGELFPDSEFF